MEKYIAELKQKISNENECIKNINKEVSNLRNKRFDIYAQQVFKKNEYDTSFNPIENNYKLEVNERLVNYLKKLEVLLSTLTLTSVFLSNQTFISLILIGSTGVGAIKYNELKKENNKLKKIEQQSKNELFLKKQSKDINDELNELENEKNSYSTQIALLEEEKKNRIIKKELYEMKLDTFNNKKIKNVQNETAKIIQFKK